MYAYIILCLIQLSVDPPEGGRGSSHSSVTSRELHSAFTYIPTDVGHSAEG